MARPFGYGREGQCGNGPQQCDEDEQVAGQGQRDSFDRRYPNPTFATRPRFWRFSSLVIPPKSREVRGQQIPRDGTRPLLASTREPFPAEPGRQTNRVGLTHQAWARNIQGRSVISNPQADLSPHASGQGDLDTLIARHRPDFAIADLLRLLSKDCPKRASVVPMTCAAFIAWNCPRSPWAGPQGR
jgi:hypothetical protein